MNSVSSVDQDGFVFNGINGTTGEYLLPPLHAAEVATLARGERSTLRTCASSAPDSARPPRTTMASVSESIHLISGRPVGESSSRTTWIRRFPKRLQPLLDHRQQQAGDLYKRFEGPSGQRLNESKDRFLARNGIGPGTVVPAKVPYYLLVVGSPDRVDFRFQSQLDVSYAVGRVYFHTPEQYECYARTIVAAETAPPSHAAPLRAVLFGVRNDDDLSTQLSTNQLVEPLAREITEPGWTIETVLGDSATKSRLRQLMGGPQTPSLLFTASHGMGFAPDDVRQVEHQGALLCQDWPDRSSTVVRSCRIFTSRVTKSAAMPIWPG